MQLLTTMYGSNFNTLKYTGGSGFSDEKEGIIFGGLQNSEKDTRNKNIDYVLEIHFQLT